MRSEFETLESHQNIEDTVEKEVIDKFTMSNQILRGAPSKYDEIVNTGKYILRKFKNSPDFIGQIDAKTGQTTTFQEMREKSIKCAIFMKEMGIKEGDTVTVCDNNSINAYIPYLACLYIGAIAKLWRVECLQYKSRFIPYLTGKHAKLIFTSSKYVMYFRNDIKTLHEKGFYAELFPKIVTIDDNVNGYTYLDSIIKTLDMSKVKNFSCYHVQKGQPAIVMYSPNTTSYNGTVEISHMMFWHPPNRRVPTMRKNDVGLWYAPLCSLYGPFLTVHAIVEQVTAIKANDFSEKGMCNIIRKYKVNWVHLDSQVYKEIFQTCDIWDDMPSLKEIVCDIEVDRRILKFLLSKLPHISIISVYSMPETGVIAYGKNVKQTRFTIYVAKTMKVMVVDRNSRIRQGPNKFGEIWCKCPYMILKNGRLQYQNLNPEFDMKPIKVDKYRISEGWFYTGYCGYYDEYGGIDVIDKISNVSLPQHFFKFAMPTTNVETIMEMNLQVKKVYVTFVHVSSANYRVILLMEADKKEQYLAMVLLILRVILKDVTIEGCCIYYIHGDVPRLPNGKPDRRRFSIELFSIMHSFSCTCQPQHVYLP